MEEQAHTFELRDSDIKERPELAELKHMEMTFPTMTFDKALSLRDDSFVVEITRVGGHTEGSSFVYFPQEHILFSGDLIFAKEFPWAGDETCNPQEWMNTLKLFKELDVEKIVPGHGPICDKSEIDKYLKFYEESTSIIKNLIDEGFTKREVMQYPDFPSFYTYERRKGAFERRSRTFARWYDFYKKPRDWPTKIFRTPRGNMERGWWLMVNFFLALVGDLVTQNQELFNETGRADGQPAHSVMKPIHGLVPGTDCDTAAATTGPFSLIHSPEDDTFFGINPPFASTGIVMHRVGDFIVGLTFWNRPRRAVLGAAFAGHTEIMRPEGNGLIGYQG